jgi:hypothetical protein
MRPFVGDVFRGFLKREKGTLGIDPEQTVKILLGEFKNESIHQFNTCIRNDNVGHKL